MSSDFSVVAIVAAYNEADIIADVVRDLIEQDIHVYFIDDGSTDGTLRAVEPFVGRGVLRIERRLDSRGVSPSGFDWEGILRRKAAIAKELDADWFIHHDADEFRESLWPDLTLLDAIHRVDTLGFNAIDFESLDFWPVDAQFRPGGDVRQALTFYARRASYDRVQIRCWKRTEDVDLASSGGHEARFHNRKVFPLRFVLRHYPIRGQAHGERKIFCERRKRFLPEERARGWHVQYDHMHEGQSFIRDAATLTRYDSDAVRLSLMLEPRVVEDLEESLREVKANLESARAESDRFCRDLEARTSELADRSAQLADRSAQLADRSAQIADLHDILNERTQQLESRDAEIAGLREALEQQRAEIRNWRVTVDDLSARLEAFERSLSWRSTAPARAAYRLIRGR